MKVKNEAPSYVEVNQEGIEIDKDTNLPVDELRSMLLEAKGSPAKRVTTEEIKNNARLYRDRMLNRK